MIRSSDIRAIWKTQIFEHDDILDITDKAHPFEIAADSEFEIEQLSFNQELNFFEYAVTRALESVVEFGGGQEEPVYRFLVEVRYTKFRGAGNQAFLDVTDSLEILSDTVRNELGSNWSGMVDVSETPTTIETPKGEVFANTPVVRGIARFSAVKQF